MNASGYTPTEEEQKAINNKKNVQKKLGYKAIKWYEEAKAYYFAKLAKTLEPLRDKLNTIR